MLLVCLELFRANQALRCQLPRWPITGLTTAVHMEASLWVQCPRVTGVDQSTPQVCWRNLGRFANADWSKSAKILAFLQQTCGIDQSSVDTGHRATLRPSLAQLLHAAASVDDDEGHPRSSIESVYAIPISDQQQPYCLATFQRYCRFSADNVCLSNGHLLLLLLLLLPLLLQLKTATPPLFHTKFCYLPLRQGASLLRRVKTPSVITFEVIQPTRLRYHNGTWTLRTENTSVAIPCTALSISSNENYRSRVNTIWPVTTNYGYRGDLLNW